MNQIIYSKWVFEDDDIRSAQIYRATSLIADSLEHLKRHSPVQ